MNDMHARSEFHNFTDTITVSGTSSSQDTKFTYEFENFFHPFVGELIEKLNKKSLSGLLDANYHKDLADLATPFFETFYTR